MNISKFITCNMQHILVEWEDFAATFGAVADKMTARELRDHAKEILQFVAKDIQTAETTAEAHAKSQGLRQLPSHEASASSTHGKLRYMSGFTLRQLIAEYRALRASVLKLWQRDCIDLPVNAVQDMMRFNEAIDQSLAEAAVAHSDKVNETRDVFLSILGHDLRSPLAATSTAGTYLSTHGDFDERIRQIGVRVKRSAATMNGMVNDLLGLARTQLGDGIPIERRSGDLQEMCQWAIDDANAAHPRAQFDLKFVGDLAGSFDQARLQQLLTNLANNAAQYGEPGKRITVQIGGHHDRVVFTVHNEGPVIPEDAMSKLFTSLVQLPEQNGNARPQGSLGLGLFIAKQIAVAHGGSIEVRSSDVAGTTFTVDIPRQ
jgi:signal transduction histidine kinase